MKKKNYFILFAIGVVSIFTSERLAAQKLTVDPRPLKGLDRTTIPAYGSIEEYLADRTGIGGTLESHARIVGTAERTTYQMIQSEARHKHTEKPFATVTPEKKLRVERASNGTIRWMNGDLGRAETFAPKNDKEKSPEIQAAGTALGVADAYAPLLGLSNPSQELLPTSVTVDDLGSRHVRMAQYYKGVPVWGRDLYIHTNADGEVYAINGVYEPTPSHASMTPRFDGSTAITVAIDDLELRGVWEPLTGDVATQLGIDPPKATLVLYPHNDGGIYLAYEVTLHANLTESYTYIIDAHLGGVLNRFAEHCSIWPEEQTGRPSHVHEIVTPAMPHAAAGGAGTFTDATGTDLNGVSRSLRTYHHTNGGYYAIWDLPNFNAAASQLPNDLSGGAVTLSADNHDLDQGTRLLHVVSTNNQWNDPSAVSAHHNMKAAYDYYRSTFGRKAIDDNDKALMSIIHVTRGGAPMDNAFWNGEFMAYGDGATQLKPLAGALDVAGHEMSHGVIEHTANLIYQGQSGALNESFADVFGIMIDRNDYLLGEDVMKPGFGPAVRDFANPDNAALARPQPAHMNDFRNLPNDDDNGGVHSNSGITNRAAYLLIQAIGRDKTEQIYYRALSSYLTRNSQFIDCRLAVEQAAKDLFGDGPEAAHVRQAFDAVGITVGEPSGDTNNVPPVVGDWMFTYLLEDGSIGTIDIPTGTTGIFGREEGAIARISQVNGNTDRAQLTTPRDGRRIYFINADGKLSFVDVLTGTVSIFPNLYLQEEGDLWNAAISPDENYVALTSAYENDAGIYIFDGTSIGRIELTPESTQEDVTDGTIQYPDVMAWSPNINHPLIGFDAYKEVTIGDDWTESAWSIYEIDALQETIYNLIPSQPSGVSIGNITYGKTDPDMYAFNVIDEDGLYDVAVVNADGDMMMLGMPSYTFEDDEIVDAQRPTFSPDDNLLGMSSPAMRALFIFNSDGAKVSWMRLPNGEAMYNPHWFSFTLPSDVETGGRATTGLALNRIAPNPFRSSTRITFSIPTTADVELDVVNTLGETVATLVKGRVTAGEHEATFHADALPAGVYIARLKSGSAMRSERIVLTR